MHNGSARQRKPHCTGSFEGYIAASRHLSTLLEYVRVFRNSRERNNCRTKATFVQAGCPNAIQHTSFREYGRHMYSLSSRYHHVAGKHQLASWFPTQQHAPTRRVHDRADLYISPFGLDGECDLLVARLEARQEDRAVVPRVGLAFGGPFDLTQEAKRELRISLMERQQNMNGFRRARGGSRPHGKGFGEPSYGTAIDLGFCSL